MVFCSTFLSSATTSGLRKMSRMRVLRWGNELISGLTYAVPQLIIMTFSDLQVQGDQAPCQFSRLFIVLRCKVLLQSSEKHWRGGPLPRPFTTSWGKLGWLRPPPFQIMGHSVSEREVSQQPQGNSSSPAAASWAAYFQQPISMSTTS